MALGPVFMNFQNIQQRCFWGGVCIRGTANFSALKQMLLGKMSVDGSTSFIYLCNLNVLFADTLTCQMSVAQRSIKCVQYIYTVPTKGIIANVINY